MYKQFKEPGVFTAEDAATPKQDGGDPATKARAALRKKCKPMGPIGLLLEAIHLQAASMDGSWTIRQLNQQPIELAPKHKLQPLIAWPDAGMLHHP